MKREYICIVMSVVMSFVSMGAHAEDKNEVFPSHVSIESPHTIGTAVYVVKHPKTGKELVCISSESSPPAWASFSEEVKRPDYRMLEPGVSPKDVGYDGPRSNRTKVYVLASTLIATGIAAGVATAVMPVQAASAGGAGAYLGAGSAIAGAAVVAPLGSQKTVDDYVHDGKAEIVYNMPEISESNTESKRATP